MYSETLLPSYSTMLLHRLSSVLWWTTDILACYNLPDVSHNPKPLIIPAAQLEQLKFTFSYPS